MDETVQRALGVDRTIDITTIGRHSGSPRTIETWFYRAGGKVYLTGSPGKRDWYANLMINPSFTFHLKWSTIADLPATARPVTDERERHRILSEIVADLNQPDSLDAWIAGSPLLDRREPTPGSPGAHSLRFLSPTGQTAADTRRRCHDESGH